MATRPFHDPVPHRPFGRRSQSAQHHRMSAHDWYVVLIALAVAVAAALAALLARHALSDDFETTSPTAATAVVAE